MSSEEKPEVKEDLPDEGMTGEQPQPEPTTSSTSTTTSSSVTTTTTTSTPAAPTSTSVSVAVGTEDLHSDDSSVSEGDVQGATGAGQPSTSRMSPDSDAGLAPSGKSLRTCRVCGDRAKSMHFGGLSCDSCKAFFRRAVHNDGYVNFSCPYDGGCVINIASRKCCQFCRYKKCTSIGMERSWVMSEEDRAQMMKQRAEKKAKMTDDVGRIGFKEGKRELVPYEPDQASMLEHMTAGERDEIERAVVNYRRAYNDMPYCHDLKNFNVDRPSIQIINMFTTVVRRFAYFARLFPDFCNLLPQDQATLLRGGILEMSLIRGVQTFDTENNRWPDTNHQMYRDAPTLRVEDMKKLVSCELYEMHMKFIHSLKELNVDEPVMMLLLLIVLFTSERPELAAGAVVQKRQDHYLQLLRKYLEWRYGPHNAPILYPRLLMKLTDLRELNDQHTEYNLKLAKQEIAEIQLQLGQLDLNRYMEWPNILQQQGVPSGPSATRGSAGSSPVQVALTPGEAGQATPADADLIGRLGSSGLLGLVDFDQLAKNPSFQRLILQQFQKSIMSVLSSPNFGLGSLFPDGRVLQEPQPSETQQREATPQQPPQSAPPQFLLQQKLPPQGPPGQVPGPSQGYAASDLRTHLEYLDSSQPGSSLQSVQHSQAFQQLENQLMSNIGGGYSSFGEQQMLQQQYQYHLQQQQQQEQQALFLQQEQMHHSQLQEGQMQQQHHHLAGPAAAVVVPKQEPMQPSSPTSHVPHPLLFDDHPYPMAQQQSPPQGSSPADGSTHPRRNSLTDYSGLTHFRNLLEEFATLNNPDHLQQVKQILGPDLVASLQQKLVAPEAPSQFPQHQETTTLPQQQEHFPSQSHLYSPTGTYQFFPEYPRQVARDDAPSSSSSSTYSPDTQYGPTETSSLCRSQHRGTSPAMAVNNVTPPPVALFPVTDSPPVIYQYTQDLPHNVTSAT